MNTAQTPESSISTISPADAQQKSLEALLLDVRTPAEFEEAHIDGSVLMPLGTLNTEEVKRLAVGKSACLLICRSVPRAPSCREAEIEWFAKYSGPHRRRACVDAAGLPLNRGAKTCRSSVRSV